MTAIPTIGVEEELALVDRRTGLLCSRADHVLAALPEATMPFVDHEMKRCQVETMSPVRHGLQVLRADLGGLRSAVRAAAGPVGCDLLATGTHPRSSWRDPGVAAQPAYRHLEEDYRRLADEQVIFGCHVHVAVDDPDLRIAVLDRVRPWLPVLLALSANSPYWEGEDTGYASYRYVLFSRWPTFGTPDALGDWAGFEAVVDGLVRAGAIDSARRLYWTIRPSARYPTLEFRIADVCATVDEAAMIAGLARGLVMTAAAEVRAGAEPIALRGELARMAEWQAARHGLDGPLMDAVEGSERTAVQAVHQLLRHVEPALAEAGDVLFVQQMVAQVLAGGTGAERQRRARRAESSGNGPTALTRSTGTRTSSPAA